MALSGSIVNEVRYGVFDFNIAGVKFIGKKQRKVLEKPPGTVIGQVLDEGGREFQLSGRLFNDLLADPFPLRFRSEERRVGKECRCQRVPEQLKSGRESRLCGV